MRHSERGRPHSTSSDALRRRLTALSLGSAGRCQARSRRTAGARAARRRRGHRAPRAGARGRARRVLVARAPRRDSRAWRRRRRPASPLRAATHPAARDTPADGARVEARRRARPARRSASPPPRAARSRRAGATPSAVTVTATSDSYRPWSPRHPSPPGVTPAPVRASRRRWVDARRSSDGRRGRRRLDSQLHGAGRQGVDQTRGARARAVRARPVRDEGRDRRHRCIVDRRRARTTARTAAGTWSWRKSRRAAAGARVGRQRAQLRVAVQRDEPSVRQQRGELASVADRHDSVAAAVQDERGHVHLAGDGAARSSACPPSGRARGTRRRPARRPRRADSA